jgi:hypothetical protein
MFNASMAIGSQDLYDTYQRDNDCIFIVQALLYIKGAYIVYMDSSCTYRVYELTKFKKN